MPVFALLMMFSVMLTIVWSKRMKGRRQRKEAAWWMKGIMRGKEDSCRNHKYIQIFHIYKLRVKIYLFLKSWTLLEVLQLSVWSFFGSRLLRVGFFIFTQCTAYIELHNTDYLECSTQLGVKFSVNWLYLQNYNKQLANDRHLSLSVKGKCARMTRK